MIKSLAVSLAVGRPDKGAKWAVLEKQSTTCVPLRVGQSGDKLGSNVGPGTVRDRERPERTSGGFVAGLALGTSVTCTNEAACVFPHGGPPKPLLDQVLTCCWGRLVCDGFQLDGVQILDGATMKPGKETVLLWNSYFPILTKS